MDLQVVWHILISGNLFIVSTILPLIQLFSSHHPSSIPLNSEDTSLFDHTHILRSPPPTPRFSSGQVGHAGEELSPSLLRCWNKSSLWSLVWFSSMGPSQHKVKRQMLNNKYTYLYLHTNFHWQELPICLTSS